MIKKEIAIDLDHQKNTYKGITYALWFEDENFFISTATGQKIGSGIINFKDILLSGANRSITILSCIPSIYDLVELSLNKIILTFLKQKNNYIDAY